MTSALTLASQTIGFISFSITLLTLLGVYSSLLSTLRSAPIQIPITLGNLRQEILAERAYLRQRCLEGRDPFGVFPGNLGGLPGNRGRRSRMGRGSAPQDVAGGTGIGEEGYARLLTYTIRDLWLEFQRLERPFLVKGGLRAKAIEKGDYWDEGDLDIERAGAGSGLSDDEGGNGSGIDEKGGARRRRRKKRRRRSGRSGRGATNGRGGFVRPGEPDGPAEWEAAEEDLRREGAKYYNTGMSHRFIWWQIEDDVKHLADQVQRIQIRRMERDLFETDELVRRLVREGGFGGGSGRAGRGRGGGGNDGSGSDSEIEARGGAIVRSRAGSRAPSRVSTTRRNFRDVEEVERIRRPAQSPAADRRQSDREANVAARRTDRRRSGPVVEYEVLRPSGGAYVIDSGRDRSVRGPRVYEEDLRMSERRSSDRNRGDR